MTWRAAWLSVVRAGALVALGHAVFTLGRDLWVVRSIYADFPAFADAQSNRLLLTRGIGIALWASLLVSARALAPRGPAGFAPLMPSHALRLCAVAIALWSIVLGMKSFGTQVLREPDEDTALNWSSPTSTANVIYASLLVAFGVVLLLPWPRAKAWIRKWVLAPRPEDLGVERETP